MSAPKHARSTSRGRTYQHPVTGETAWSVTTIIGAGVPKHALPYWYAKVVAEFAVANHRQLTEMLKAVRLLRSDDKRLLGVASDPVAIEAAIDWLKGEPNRHKERKGNIGSAVHEWIDATILDKPLVAPTPEVAPYLPGFIAFREKYKPEFLASEMTVWNRSESYAGTLDWIARIGGRTLLGDNKTGSDVYPEAALQLAALSQGEFALLDDGTEEPLPPIDGAAVLHLKDDGTFRLLPVLITEPVFKAFLYAREVMRFAEEISKTVIGDPLQGPEGVAFLYPETLEMAA